MMQGWTSTKFMFLVLILNPKRRPWQDKLIVRDTIIINMVDTGILISFHNYWTEPTLQHVHLIVIYKVCEILSIIIANISQFDNFLKKFWFNWNWALQEWFVWCLLQNVSYSVLLDLVKINMATMDNFPFLIGWNFRNLQHYPTWYKWYIWSPIQEILN